jgi:hypothetical protein
LLPISLCPGGRDGGGAVVVEAGAVLVTVVGVDEETEEVAVVPCCMSTPVNVFGDEPIL